MNENEKDFEAWMVEAINNLSERIQRVDELNFETTEAHYGFIEAKMEKNEKALEAINNRFERMESLRKLEWEALQGQNAFNEAKMDALEERIEKLGG